MNIHTRRARDRTSADQWLDDGAALRRRNCARRSRVLVEGREGRDGELLAWASAAKPAVLCEARFSRGGDAAAR